MGFNSGFKGLRKKKETGAESRLQNTLSQIRKSRTNSTQVSSAWNPIVRFQHNVRPSPHAAVTRRMEELV